jgi:hypothetical protein
MEDQDQPFAAFVFETLMRQSTELGRWWSRHTRDTTADPGDPESDGGVSEPGGSGAERLVQTLLAAAADGARRHDSLRQAGEAIGAEAHRRSTSLHLMLEKVDLLGALVLRAAEGVAEEYRASATGPEGLAVARRIAGAASQLRLAACAGYTRALEQALRERYRAIRHELRNEVGTIKSAVALLTDDSLPTEMRESSRVRAMVARNTSSLEQLIGKALSDSAVRLRAFEIPREGPVDVPTDSPGMPTPSARE